MPSRKLVLVTGAAGRIGSYFCRHTHDTYRLRMLVHREESRDQLASLGEVVVAGLEDLDALKRACEGVDTVLHLAANASASATWRELLSPNIVGTYNIYVAAKSAGCRRVVFASSIHAVSGYPAERQVHEDDLPNPGDLYGVTKVFGEAMGRYMAEQEGLSVIAIRIGGFASVEVARDPDRIAAMDAFVSDRDLAQLFRRAIDDEELRFGIFHGVSDNKYKRLDITLGRELLGYSPQDDFAEYNPSLQALAGMRRRAHSLSDGQSSGLRDDL